MQRIRNLICDESASELIEFSLAASVFFSLIFAIIGFSFILYTYHFVVYTAEEGARYAMVRGSDWTNACSSTRTYDCQAATTNVQNYVLSLPHGVVTVVASDITVSWPGTTTSGVSCGSNAHAQGCEVQVTVAYTYSLKIPFIPQVSFPMSSTSTQTIQN